MQHVYPRPPSSAFALVAIFAASVASAAPFSIDSVIVAQSGEAEIGSGVGGGDCVGHGGTSSNDSCAIQDSHSGSVAGDVPVNASFIVLGTSSSSGTSSTAARVSAGTQIDAADDFDVEIHGEGTFLTGFMHAVATLRDAPPEGWHTSAYALASVDDWFDVTIPSDGEFYFRLRILSAESTGLTLQHDGVVSVIDLTTNEVLFSRSDPSFTEEFDLTPYAGLPLRFAFETTVEMAGEAGFANGAESLGQRTFQTVYHAPFAFRHIVVPEPSTLPLLALGLVALPNRTRRWPPSARR